MRNDLSVKSSVNCAITAGLQQFVRVRCSMCGGVDWLQALWTMSFRVDEVCERIIQTGLHVDMLSNLGWDTLSVQTLNDPKSGTKRDFVEAHIATLHNVVRKTQTARRTLKQCNALQVVHKFRSCTEFPVIFYLFPAIRRAVSNVIVQRVVANTPLMCHRVFS